MSRFSQREQSNAAIWPIIVNSLATQRRSDYTLPPQNARATSCEFAGQIAMPCRDASAHAGRATNT
jgi:hypothetical protein